MDYGKQLLRIISAEKTPDGRVRVDFSDRSYSLLTLADIMSAGLFHGDFLPAPGRTERVHGLDDCVPQ